MLGRWWAEMIEIPCIVLGRLRHRFGRDGRGNRCRVRRRCRAPCSPKASIRATGRARQRPARRNSAAFREDLMPSRSLLVLPSLFRRRWRLACPPVAVEPAASPAVRIRSIEPIAPARPTRPPAKRRIDSAGECRYGASSIPAFGDEADDPAYGAFQRGLYKTASISPAARRRTATPPRRRWSPRSCRAASACQRDEAEAAKWYALPPSRAFRRRSSSMR